MARILHNTEYLSTGRTDGTIANEESFSLQYIGAGTFQIGSMTMNRQHTHTLTHFGPLFITALGGWLAYNLVNGGGLYVVPGLIVAGLLAYGGTLVALRTQTIRDLRTTYPAARTTGQFPTVAVPHNLARFSPRPAYSDMDIAAGD